MFRSHAKWFYMLVTGTVLFLFIQDHSLLPNYRDMIVLPVIGSNVLLLSLTSCLLIFLHECAHMLAAYGMGVHARMRVNLRYIFLVAETEMTGLWGHPKEKRYFPYLAGMALDACMILVALLVQLAAESGSLTYLVARMIVLILVLGLLSQFMIFLRTDLYYVLGNLTHSADLAQSGKLFIRKLWRRNPELRTQWVQLPVKERHAARWFGIVHFLGIAVMTFMFAVYSIPGAYIIFEQSIRQVTEYPIQSIPFWDGSIILSIAAVRLALYAMGIQTSLRDRRRKREFRAQ